MTKISSKCIGSAAAATASSINDLANKNPTYTGTTKDASHAAFYAGAAKGFVSAMQGILLFLSTPGLRAQLKDTLRSTLPLQAVYLALLLATQLLPHSDTSLLWALSRWSRIVSLLTTFVLERRLHATDSMFFEALDAHEPAFGAAVRGAPRAPKSTRDKMQKLIRVAKLSALRAAGAAVQAVLPGGQFVVLPVLKYVAMRGTLGGPVAAAVAAVHALPAEWLLDTHVDDVLLSVTEAVIDADEVGVDAVKPYLRRLGGVEAKEYFVGRYRGYLCGMGFVYSALQAIPFLGIPVVLLAECGAAVTVVDVVRRNLDKENRVALSGEESLRGQSGIKES